MRLIVTYLLLIILVTVLMALLAAATIKPPTHQAGPLPAYHEYYLDPGACVYMEVGSGACDG